MKYIKRIADKEIDKRIKAFNAINITGPKGCGKTRTATERCKTIIEFQDEEKRAGYISVAETSPTLFFNNQKPILFDEWQDAPKIWGAIRKDCDDNPKEIGNYFLTGSTSKHIETPHTGTGRITEMVMYPMTLWETGESNGSISISEMFDNKDYITDGKLSTLTLPELFFAAARGGWPRCLALSDKNAQLEIAKDYFRQVYQKDISALDGVNRNSEIARTLIWSYARNMATLAKKNVIYADVKAEHQVTDATLASYIEVLQQLYVIRDIDAWTPQIRSKTSIRNSKKHIFVDPSIGIAALGLSPEYFNNDLDLFGHVFENMVLRDLLAFAQANNGRIMHYSDDNGLEADAVYQHEDGRYALIEIKVGENAVPKAEKNLLKFREIIREHNKKVLKDEEHPGVVYREPDFLIVICGNATMSYTTKDGVKIIPIGCMKD